jgi:peroxiredoxin
MKLAAGAPFPEMTVAQAGGGEISLGGAGRWQAVIIYRGRHCPLCKKYLKVLDGLKDEFEATGIALAAVSGDPREKAEADVAEGGWRFPVGYGLTVPQMRQLGLYISDPRSPQETDRPFPEPGLFVINDQGQIQIVDISNAPFARPDLQGVLGGIRFIREKSYPIRGMAG